jgi:uncharacterized membrane protein
VLVSLPNRNKREISFHGEIKNWRNNMTQINSKEDSVVAVYPLHEGVENAINLLKKANFNVKDLAIVGQGYHKEDQFVGCYTMNNQMKHWGEHGAFWGALGGMLLGSGLFLIPGVGPVIAAGSAVAWIVGAVEGAQLVGGLSWLGAALYSVGISKDSALNYEKSIKEGKFLLIAHGTPEEVEGARQILTHTAAEYIGVHTPGQPAAAA